MLISVLAPWRAISGLGADTGMSSASMTVVRGFSSKPNDVSVWNESDEVSLHRHQDDRPLNESDGRNPRTNGTMLANINRGTETRSLLFLRLLVIPSLLLLHI